MDGVEPKMKIVPFRGDYYELTEQAKERIEKKTKTEIGQVADGKEVGEKKEESKK